VARVKPVGNGSGDSGSSDSDARRLIPLTGQATPDVIYVTDLAKREITYLTHSFYELLGYSTERTNEILATDPLSIVHPDDLATVLELRERWNMVEDGDGIEWDMRIADSDGLYRTFSARAVVSERDTSGKPVKTIAVARDVTESKAIVDELKAREERYQAFIRNSTEGIYRLEYKTPIPIDLPEEEQLKMMKSFNWTIEECNDAFTHMYAKRSQEEIEGIPLRNWGGMPVELVQDSNRAFIRSNYRLQDALTAELDSLGNRRYFNNSAIGIVEDGKLIRVWGTQTDITDRKYLEGQLAYREGLYRDALEAADAVAYQFDFDSKSYSYLGPGIKALVGLTSDEFTPERWETMVVQRVMQGQAQGLESFQAIELFDSGVLGVWQSDNRILCPDGKERWILDVSVAVLDEEGRVSGSLGLLKDITDRYQIIEALRKSEDEVRQLNAELEQRVDERTKSLELAVQDLESFTYSVSHDLRAPLRNITGMVDMLLAECGESLSGDAASMLKHIASSSARMTDIIRDLLHMAKFGQRAVERASVDTTRLAEQVVDYLKRTMEVEAGRSYFEVLPMPIAQADASLLEQVYLNLATNSLKFSGGVDSPTIQFGFQEDGNGGAYYVADNGIGFTEDEARTLFTPFQRLRGASGVSGSGIGLAIVRRIVETHGGRIWTVSEPGYGATFYFTLPA